VVAAVFLNLKKNKAIRHWFCGLILAYTSRVSNYTMSTNIVSTPPTSSTCRVILLLDMDAYFASIEERDNPALKGLPVIVGSPPPRSIVTTASRPARVFGIYSSMPMSTAKKLCPHGQFIAPRINHYKTISATIQQIVATVAGPQAILEPVALDEIYIDLTAYCSAATDDDALRMALPYAMKMKQEILKNVNLTCTIGIAANKMLAKMASDKNKPNGLGIILESTKVAELSAVPVKDLYGVGEVKEAQLNDAGIKTAQDIRNYTGNLSAVVGNSLGSKLKDLANGIDPRPVQPRGLPKSISKEHTFPKNESNSKVLDSILLAQAHYIASELKTKKLVAFTVFVVACHKHPDGYTRQETFPLAVSTAQEIFNAGQSIINTHGIYAKSLYKLGVGVTNLCPSGNVVPPASSSKKGAANAGGAGDNLTLFDATKL